MAFAKPKQNWFIRYKLYHIPFWVLYDYVLWALRVDSISDAARHMFMSVYFFKSAFYIIFPAFAVYFNLYYLVPRYLEQGRYTLYLTYLALTVVVSSILIAPGYYITSWLAGSSVEKIYGFTTNFRSLYELIKEEPFRSTVAATTLAMSIKLAKNWIESKRHQQALEKEKLETELKFLKYQFNPHFLFNSINSIFFLIHKNPDMASASLAKFSELLRHQLYDCNDHEIPLIKELAYLKNFIELEKLRQNAALEITLDTNVGDFCPLDIAPFILMAFVENAFKHVSKDKQRANWIHISLTVTDNRLWFKVANTASTDASTELIHYSGIGLKNVERRLQLIYPGKHQLEINRSEDSFTVNLGLELSASTAAASPAYLMAE
ncbi:sensor histidine kinase [Mucilaginibacter pedocola]|uniref:Histidine kinase n=1 Tax=Mucilaginibacter pedocola TaxID=1792845 RepID=A0A1S9PJU9_9SPHI|nr:histidine kinase [Mucilaginibacter pedocola]OOQ61189.1 histidine kinase [Mucilaginibacter pedocola]